jgi:hypothetical protein
VSPLLPGASWKCASHTGDRYVPTLPLQGQPMRQPVDLGPWRRHRIEGQRQDCKLDYELRGDGHGAHRRSCRLRRYNGRCASTRGDVAFNDLYLGEHTDSFKKSVSRAASSPLSGLVRLRGVTGCRTRLAPRSHGLCTALNIGHPRGACPDCTPIRCRRAADTLPKRLSPPARRQAPASRMISLRRGVGREG